MKLSTIERRMMEAEQKYSDYHMRAFWAFGNRATQLYKLSDFWYAKWLYWSDLWEEEYSKS